MPDELANFLRQMETLPMNRVILSVALSVAFSSLLATDACAQSPCCDTPCPQTCCSTVWKTQVSYRPVTKLRCEKFVDQCGICRTRWTPYTTYQRVCRRVPVTVCRQTIATRGAVPVAVVAVRTRVVRSRYCCL